MCSGSLARVNPAKVPLRRELLQALPGPLLRLHRALPMELHEETLILGMEDPRDLAVQETVRRLTGWDVLAVQLCPEGGPLPGWAELQKTRAEQNVCEPFKLEQTLVEANVVGPVVRVKLTQTYRNNSSLAVEGLFRVPIPHSAVQQGFWADREGRPLTTAAPERVLLGGRLHFSARTEPVQPAEAITLTLSYVHPLERDSEGFRLHLPCPIGEAPFEGRLQFEGEDLQPEDISCTRPASWQRLPNGALSVSLQPQTGSVARDLVCHIRVRPHEFEGRLLSDGHHFLLQLRLSPAQATPAARDIVFLLDRSASLEGWTAEQGRRAVLQCLRRLRPLDRFSLAIFDHQVVSWQDGRRVGSGSLSSAKNWLQYQAKGGGTTDLVGALEWLRDLARRNQPGRPLYAVLISDGQGGRQAEACRVASTLRAALRLFTLGVGPNCEEHFLGLLASLAGGSSEIAPSSQDLTTATERLCQQIGPPTLSQVRLVGQGFHSEPAHQHPNRLPDLFPGQALTVVGKHQGSGPLLATGLSQEGPISIALTPTMTDHPALASLWARAQVNALQRTLGQVATEQRNAVVEQMRQLRLEYLLDATYADALLSPEAWVRTGSAEAAPASSRLADSLLEQAVLRQATHIHVETGQQVKVRLRVCGRLQPYQRPFEATGHSESLALIGQFKKWCRLHTLLHQFQNGRFVRDYCGQSYLFEVSFCPAINGEKVVLEIRPARRDHHSTLAQPGRSAVESLLTRRRGLLLVCGPQGSGGNSLMVDWLATRFPDRHCVLCHKEEWFGLENVTQVLAHSDTASLLNELNGHDIDVLACTRTRDPKAWEALLGRANERSLVLARHHARSAAGALVDLVEQGLDGRLLGKCFVGAISLQRLPRLCSCKVPEKDPALLEILPEQGSCWAASGCPKCHGSGFLGHILCSEILLYRPDLFAVLRPGLNSSQVEKALIRYPMEQQLRRLAEQGQIEAKHCLSAGNTF
jgi:type II secretory ATPase GspE/PulE/Tfp pilus assembly ATPase PilB-like protein